MRADRTRRRVLAALVAAVCALVVTAAVPAAGDTGTTASSRELAAQSAGESIPTYDVAITARQDGSLDVVETIIYDFGNNQKRGIFRFIPETVRFDDVQDRVYRIDITSVAVQAMAGDTPRLAGNFDVFAENDFRVVQVGDVNTFITGRYRYTIGYRVDSAINTVESDTGEQTWERLDWNVIGTEWDVPIGAATATIGQPAAPINTRCFKGARGSVDRCPSADLQGTDLVLDMGSLGSREGATVALEYPVGSFTNATARLERRQTLAASFEATPVTLGVGSVVGLLTGFGIFSGLGRRARDRRLVLNAYLPADHDPDREDLVSFFEKPDGPVQFRPPDGVRPGLAGTLVDERADALDVSASIVDLAVRGYLRIEEYADEKFRIHVLRRSDPSLMRYEMLLLEGLTKRSSGGVVELSALERVFHTDLESVQSAMYDETMERRWFTRRPDLVRSTWVGVGAFATVLAVIITFVLAGQFLGLIGLPLIAGGLAIVFASKHMPARTGNGRTVLEHLVGYERFLEVADADQIQFNEQQNVFVEALPYAMIFGLTHKWAEVLEDLAARGFDLTPTWYVGPYNRPFRYYYFGSAMNSFSRHSSRSMASVPQNTSSSGGGFSGGGFSGGGGGGGGGGSW